VTSGRGKTTSRKGRFDPFPPWLQGVAAVAGVIGTVVAVAGLLGALTRPGPGASTAPSSQGVTARVTLESVAVAGADIRGSGEFQGLDPDRDVVLFIGQPTAGDEDWLPVVAQLLATSIGPDGAQSGDWEAVRPAGAGPYTWYAVIGPRGSGAGDPYVDLRENGPASELAKAVSEEFTTGE